MRAYLGRPLLVAVSAGLLLSFAAGCSREARKARRLAPADRYFAAGEYDKAEIEYKNVLQLGGLDPQAISRLGIIYLEQGRVARSAPFLNKGAELQPDNLELRIKLGYFYLAVGKPNLAYEAAGLVLDKKPDDLDAPILLAESVAQPKELEDARRRLQKVPTTNAAALVALGLLDFRERKLATAEPLFERARQANPKLPIVHAALGRLYWARNELERAEKAYATAAENAPPRSPVWLQAVQFNLQTGRTATARRMLEESMRKTPDYLPSYLVLASLLANEKKYDECLALVDKVLARDGDHAEALLLSAQTRLAKGEKEKALATLEKAASLYPQSPQVHFYLGSAQLAHGDTGGAATSFAQSVKLAPGFPAAVLALAQVNIRQGNLGPAIEGLKKLLQQNSNINEAKLLLAGAYRSQGNHEEALAIFRQIAAANPNNPQIQFLIGSTLLQQNKKTEARAAFTKTLELSPDFLPAFEQLVNLDVADKQPAAAQARVEGQIAKAPQNPALHLLLAKVHMGQGRNQEAEAALQKTIELQPDSPVAFFMLAQLYINTKQVTKALANLQEVVTKNPKDVGALMLMGVLNEEQKNYPAARDNYEKIVAINPKAGTALNNLAYLYSERLGEPDKALDTAQKAREALPNQAETADTLGWILYKKRQYSRALTLLEDSGEKLPENAEAQFHLGMVRYMMGDEAGARTVLEKALSLNKDFPGADEARQALAILAIDVANPGGSSRSALEQAIEKRKEDPVALSRLAAVYEREGNVERAVASYEAALKGNPSNVGAALGLIRIHRAKNERVKALELAKATRKVAPMDARVAHVLGRLAFENNETGWSLSLLQEAAQKQPNDPEVLFDFAEAAYAMGQIPNAETALRDALRAAPKFPRADKARQFLELIEAAQNPAKAAAAASVVDAALKADPASVAALMAKAAIDENKSDFKSAKTAYETALTRHPDFSPAKRRLAILYAEAPQLGDPQKALELATKSREVYSTDADVAKALGIILFRQGTFNRAATLLQESARTRTNDAVVMYYLGMSQRQLKDTTAGNRSLQRAIELGLPENLAAEARRAMTPAK